MVFIQNGNTGVGFMEALVERRKIMLDPACKVKGVLRSDEIPEPS